MSLLMLELEPDLAGHVAVALHRHRAALTASSLAEPPGLEELETAVLRVAKHHEPSHGISRWEAVDTEPRERDYLTRQDVSRRADVSLATVDRWIASGELRSSKRGRIRRIARADLERFLGAA